MFDGIEVSQRRITITIVIVLALMIGFAVTIVIEPFIQSVLQKSGSTVGGQGNIWAIIIMLPVVLMWGIALLKSRPVVSVGLLIIAFPFLGRTRDFLFIPFYVLPDGNWVERIGLTSLLILVMFIVFVARKIPLRQPKSQLFVTVEVCLWLFVGFGSVAQLVHHPPITATLFAFNGMWQYLLWFYVLIGSIRVVEDVKYLFASFVCMLIVNIGLRFLFTGILYDLTWANADMYAVFRYGAGGLGWALNYSILLVIGIALAIGLMSSVKSWKAKVMWLILGIVQTVELLFTFTRGAYISFIVVLLLLLSSRSTRRSAELYGIVLLGGLLGTFALSPKEIQTVLVARADIREYDTIRVELLRYAINDIFHDGGFGFGIFLEPIYVTKFASATAHNTILGLTQSIGLWSALAWVGIVLAPVLALIRSLRCQLKYKIKKLAIPLIAASIGWFLFANGTGTGVVAYYPFESNQAVYFLIALSVGLLSMSYSPKTGQGG